MLTDRLGLPAAGRGAVRPRRRALGRQGPARSCEGARRSRCPCGSSTWPETPPSSACWAATSSPRAWSASGRAAPSIPPIATPLADEAAEILALDAEASAWEETLALRARPAADPGGRGDRPRPGGDGRLRRPASRRTWSATRPASPSWRPRRPQRCRLDAADVVTVRRAALVHDLGRVAVPVRIWQKPGPLTPDDWERVQAARVPHRARPHPLAVPGGARAGRQRPPRASRRLGLPPRIGRRGAHAARAPARRRRRLPRDDRAAAAPRRHCSPGAGRRDPRPRRPAPDGWTPTPSPRCSRRPGSGSRESSGRPG